MNSDVTTQLQIIKEKYELAKKSLTKNNITFNINIKSVTKAYSNAILNINNEYDNFKKKKGHYSIVTSDTLTQHKLQSEIKKITNKFLYLIDPLINDTHVVAIEEEDNIIEQLRIEEMNVAKNIEMLHGGAMLIASPKTHKSLSDSYWF